MVHESPIQNKARQIKKRYTGTLFFSEINGTYVPSNGIHHHNRLQSNLTPVCVKNNHNLCPRFEMDAAGAKSKKVMVSFSYR